MIKMIGDWFKIDVDEETQENAIFKDDNFICFEDDSEKLVEQLNALYKEKESMKNLLQIHISFCKSKGYGLRDIIEFAGVGFYD